MNPFKRKKDVLVLGSDGMLGSELYARLRDLSAKGRIGVVYGMDRAELEAIGIKDRYALGDEFFMNSRKFDVCVNCVAMTDTKAAESTMEGRRLSYELNALAPKFIAQSCVYWGVKMVHVSTDYVFDGKDPDCGNMFGLLTPESPPRPRSIYGMHKLIGEQFVEEAFRSGGKPNDFAVCRTSWLYGEHGQKSFVHKIVKAAAKAAAAGQDHIDVTSNEWSVPTSVDLLVGFIIQKFVLGWRRGMVFHVVPFVKRRGTDGLPAVSRTEWAKEILSSFGAFKEDEQYGRLFGVMSADSFVNPVEREPSFYPEYSAMNPSPAVDDVFGCSDWLPALVKFMEKNMPAMKALAVEEFEAAGCPGR